MKSKHLENSEVFPEVSSQILCKLISYIKCYYNTNRTKDDMLQIFYYNNPNIYLDYRYFSKVYDCVHKSLMELAPGERFDKIQVEKSVRKYSPVTSYHNLNEADT